MESVDYIKASKERQKLYYDNSAKDLPIGPGRHRQGEAVQGWRQRVAESCSEGETNQAVIPGNHWQWKDPLSRKSSTEEIP